MLFSCLLLVSPSHQYAMRWGLSWLRRLTRLKAPEAVVRKRFLALELVFNLAAERMGDVDIERKAGSIGIREQRFDGDNNSIMTRLFGVVHTGGSLGRI